MCENLESITIPSTGELRTLNIDIGAFSGGGIESFVVPDSVSDLQFGKEAFSECRNLKTFKLPSNPKLRDFYIKNGTFYDTGIELFIFPKNIKELLIDQLAFVNCHIKCLDLSLCTELERIEIGAAAFRDSDIESFIVPDSVSELVIGTGAFSNSKLKTFKLPSNPEFRYFGVDFGAFRDSDIESFIVPDSVSNLLICDKAFYRCKNLKTFKLPSNLEFEFLRIGKDAFYSSGIGSFIFPENVKELTIGEDAFAECPIKCLDLSLCTELKRILIIRPDFEVLVPEKLKWAIRRNIIKYG